MTESISRISSQTHRDLFPFYPCSLSVLCAARTAGVSTQYCEDMSCAADGPACPHCPHCFTCHHSSPSSAWIQCFNARMPECTFLGEFFKLTLCFPKRVYLVGLLYITLTAGVTLTDSFLWNFYSCFNTSDGVQCYPPPFCFHCAIIGENKTLRPGRVFPFP